MTSATAVRNAVSFLFEGSRYPLTFLTNCSAAALISSSEAGASPPRRVLMLLHIHEPYRAGRSRSNEVAHHRRSCARAHDVGLGWLGAREPLTFQGSHHQLGGDDDLACQGRVFPQL